MPEFHSEPYIYLPAVSHNSVLIAWGAFYFRTNSTRSTSLRAGKRWKIVDDDDLKYVHPPRKDSIGAQSAPYGPAKVEVYDSSGKTVACAKTEVANHCWLAGLQPDTEYTYKVFVKGQEWASGVRWDWSPREHALVQSGAVYDNRFKTFPDPKKPAEHLTFAVIGDFGVGMRRDAPTRRQMQVAYALRQMVDTEDVRLLLTTGDNIYATARVLGVAIGETGDEDDDWFFTYFQPYRYVINRIPVYPSIGNHDADETEEHDDRGQVEDNFYLRERMSAEEAAGRASFCPGLFYRFRFGSEIEFVCIDTSKEAFFRGYRLFEFPKHWDFVEQSFPAEGPHPAWRIPFAHHPIYSAGPRHHNTRGMEKLLPLFERSGVRVMFSGHEHNFQHSRTTTLDHFVTGAAGKVRRARPDGFAGAHTSSWATDCHFLLARIDGARMSVRAIGAIDEPGEVPTDIERFDVEGNPVRGDIEIEH